MKVFNLFSNNIEKCILFLFLISLVFCMSSCTKHDMLESRTSIVDNILSKDQLKMQFGYAFAKVLAEDSDVREIVKEEALKKIDYDYDVLYMLIKDRKNHAGNTIEDLVLRYISTDSLSIIIDMLPNLTIFVPELPENVFSAQVWDAFNVIPKVAVRLDSSNDVPILDELGNKRVLCSSEIPAFPVVVIKENERMLLNMSSHTRTFSDKALNNNALMFIDSAFDNMSMKTRISRDRRSAIGSTIGKTMDSRFAKLKEAYEKYPIGTGWQRDYIYYDISSTKPNGPFNYQYKEFLWGFEMTGDVLGAIRKISDQTGDPQYNGNVRGKHGDKLVVEGNGWTDGEFEFKVKVYVASKTGVGNEFVTYFRVKASKLFWVTGTRKGDVYTIYSAKNAKVLFETPIPLFSWNLEDYSSTIKIAIEEVDAVETITQTNTTTSEFATNFGFDATFGEGVKLGAKYGVSAKTTKTVTYQVSTTKGNDELGEVIVNFGDEILKDTTVLGSPKAYHPYYLNLSPQYYTGWYRLYIAPGPIN